MASEEDSVAYEEKQRKAIQAWKKKPPSVVERWIGPLFKPVAWAIHRLVPPSAIEGALRGADWLAQLTISKDQVYRAARVTEPDDLQTHKLSELDALADGVHRWAVGYAVAEGGAAGAAGLLGMALDVPSLITLTLRTVRAIGVCYGFVGDSEAEREFVLGVISAAGANSVAEKAAALLFLRQLEVTLLRQTFKAMAQKAAEQAISKEAAIIALRDIARQLGINLTKRKMLQSVPFIGVAVGATVNFKFMDDVAWAARRSYQERWFAERDRKALQKTGSETIHAG